VFQSNFVQEDAFQILRFFLTDLINRNFELSFTLHNQYETVVNLIQPAYASQVKRVENDLIKTVEIKKNTYISNIERYG